jgi:hypothetical protein
MKVLRTCACGAPGPESGRLACVTIATVLANHPTRRQCGSVLQPTFCAAMKPWMAWLDRSAMSS